MRQFNKAIKNSALITLIAALSILSFQIGYSQTTQTFSTSGTFTFIPPAGVTQITVECWGGGGAGGGESEDITKGGGGGGTYAKKTITVVPGTSYAVTVAAAKSGTYGSGSTGNPSWFGSTSTVFAQGGAGGAKPNRWTALGGIGSSSSSIGDLVYAGGNGANGSSVIGGAGGGGSGSTGAGGNASGINAGTGTSIGGGNGGAGLTAGGNGNPGTIAGGGGSGAFVNDGTDRKGGSGEGGQVLITYTCSTYSITGMLAGSSVCPGSTANITLSNTTTGNLPVGTYNINYNLSGANTSTGNTASMTVSTAGTGIFTTISLTNSGTTTITITNLQSGSGTGCSSSISTGNTATVASPSAIISYTGSPYCSNGGTATVTFSGTTGGTYTSTTGLSINSATGAVALGMSTLGTYTVTYTIAAAGGCSQYQTTASITVITPGTWSGGV